MTSGRNAVRILFVDQAVGFGGSIIVISNLLTCLKKTHFAAVVVGEMDPRILAHHVGGRAKLEILHRPLNYVHMESFSNFLRRWRSPPLHRVGMYLFTIAAAIANLAYMIRLGAVIVRERIDVMHVNQSDNTEAIVTGLVLGRKIVIHVHGTGHAGLSYRWIMRAIPHVVAISEYIKRDLIENRVPESRISVVPNPTIIRPPSKQALERVKATYGIVPGQKIFGIFGRLVRWKGHAQFIHAAQIVLAKEPTARAFIVGDVSDGDKEFLHELKAMVQRSGIQNKVTFTGYVREVDRMYSVMDLVVHASIEPEPFGLVITEAMAHGIPVVASTLGATGEIITHGYDGLLVDPRQPEELASAILRLLRDDTLRETMGARAMETVQHKYNGDVYAERMGEVYRTVVGLA